MNELDRYNLDFDFYRFKAGDEQIFEKIFKSKFNQIAGFCKQFVFDDDKSQSITQEAFIKLWLNREKVNTLNGINSFLYTAAKTECLNYLRHERIKSKYFDNSIRIKESNLNQEILESFNFDNLEFLELENAIKQGINELPERCKQVFSMSRQEGKSNMEIAEELGIALKSVESNMTRALKFIRKRISEFISIIFAIFWYF